MAVATTPEELARKILAIFARNRIQAGGTLMMPTLPVQAPNVGLGPMEVRPAIQAAQDLGWIEGDGMMSVRLTQAGFDEM